MPFIRLQTNITNRAVRRKFVEAVDSVFAGMGVVREHITTLVTTVDSADLYVGSHTFAEHVSPDAGFALVFIHMSRSRGDNVRLGLARAVVEAFDGVVEPQQIAVEFIDREVEDVYIANIPLAVRRSAGTGVPPAAVAPPVVAKIDDQVRRALAARWGQHVLTAAADTLLEELYPAETSWDSLAKAELAYYLEVVLDLSKPLDTGQETVQHALSSTATLEHLVSALETCVS